VSKAQLVITARPPKSLARRSRSPAEVARTYNIARSWVFTLVAGYRAEVIAEVRMVNDRYSVGTIWRVLLYDLCGRATPNHLVTNAIEREGARVRRH
jgi:hypothetical protein